LSAAAFKCTARDLLLSGGALLRELDAIINGDRSFLSPRIQTLRAIRAKLRPEPVRERYGHYEPPRVGARRRRRSR